MHLNLTVGSGLPFGVVDNNIIFRNPYRFAPYHRVDIGFGFQLWKDAWRKKHPHHFLRFTRDTWASLEVFNLMKVANEASNTWIKTNRKYPVRYSQLPDRPKAEYQDKNGILTSRTPCNILLSLSKTPLRVSLSTARRFSTPCITTCVWKYWTHSEPARMMPASGLC